MPERPLPPRRQTNKHEREHEYVTYEEHQAIAKAAASTGRHRERDHLMIKMAFRHGLRAVEVTRLKWDHVDLERRTLTVVRAKKGKRSVHDLNTEELKALRKTPADRRSGYVFLTERDGPLVTNAFFKIVRRAGELAGYTKPLHPHMFRHGCGFHMTNKGVHIRVIQDWLGHQNIQHTVRYTELSPDRLRGAFPDEA
jgi:type 1 fimbriae regulatory protein FimB/type 1 fimbriae regulatory protein FimE